MINLRRLNLDTSWQIYWANQSFLLDPWLVNSEVDYFKWFNEQWHVQKPVHPNDLEQPDFILISQSYSDHTHEATLELFDKNIPILASPKAWQRLRKTFSSKRLIKLPLLAKDGLLEFNGFQIASIHPVRKLDPVYYAHIIAKDDQAIFYSCHGFQLNDLQLKKLQTFNIQCLLTSFSEIQLPFFLGGKVNPGLENVNYLIETLKPNYVLNTHDEQKKHAGLVMKMARCTYPDFEKLQFPNVAFLNVQDYGFRELNYTY